jgi:predicted dehydrogenase
VFVEKPLATKVSEVDELSRCASKQNLVVITGHTFAYNSAVRCVKKLIDAGELGELRYVYGPRLTSSVSVPTSTLSGTSRLTILASFNTG